MGLFKDVGEISQWVRPERVIAPRAENHARYEPLYQIYLKLYQQTHELMGELSALRHTL